MRGCACMCVWAAARGHVWEAILKILRYLYSYINVFKFILETYRSINKLLT